MRYLHSMVRVRNLEGAIEFYCGKLGLQEVYRYDNEKGRFTNVFLKAPDDDVGEAPKERRMGMSTRVAPVIELTYNWDPEEYTGGRNFGHLAFGVENIYEFCERLMKRGITINRPPCDGKLAFIKSPDGISIELLQEGDPLPPAEPWLSMPNTGTW
ncbi:VOC family protein [Candidatus Kaiserbacteria bacterium]|nr:VOC family protein [Candidatus Kaiserbacteria bacterium]